MRLEELPGRPGPWPYLCAADAGTLEDAARALERRDPSNVTVRVCRGTKCRTEEGLFDEFAAALQFPAYFGENRNAFDECLDDLDWIPNRTLIVVVREAAHLLERESSERRAMLWKLLESQTHAWANRHEAPTDSETSTLPGPRFFHLVLHAPPEQEMTLRELLRGHHLSFDEVEIVS